MELRTMRMEDYDLEALWEEEISKAALVAFRANGIGNGFWESVGFPQRGDLVYRNRSFNENNG